MRLRDRRSIIATTVLFFTSILLGAIGFILLAGIAELIKSML
jgi:hypothetical protein